jgi:hypothetical protein
MQSKTSGGKIKNRTKQTLGRMTDARVNVSGEVNKSRTISFFIVIPPSEF